jgi:hypothetical protein
MKEFLEWCGKAFMDKHALKYATADIDKLPDVLKNKLRSYVRAYVFILAGLGLPIVHARLWSAIVAVIVIGWGFRQRSEIRAELDGRIKPYIKEDSRN